jgi:hypothetical protein
VTTPTKGKPTAREVWDAIDDESFKAEVEGIVAMSDAELEAELIKDGFDPAKLGAGESKAGAPAPDKEATEAKPAPVRRLPLRTRAAPWLMAAAMVALVVGAIAVNKNDGGSTHPPPPAERAAELRDEAKAECAKAQWQTCLDRLDEADRLDPGGADDATVKALRRQAEEGVRPRR